MRNRIVRLSFAALAASALAGCATPGPGSVKGACDSFIAPTVAIAGQTSADQGWIDDTIESGVASCHWKRPAKRPTAKAKVPK